MWWNRSSPFHINIGTNSNINSPVVSSEGVKKIFIRKCSNNRIHKMVGIYVNKLCKIPPNGNVMPKHQPNHCIRAPSSKENCTWIYKRNLHIKLEQNIYNLQLRFHLNHNAEASWQMANIECELTINKGPKRNIAILGWIALFMSGNINLCVHRNCIEQEHKLQFKSIGLPGKVIASIIDLRNSPELTRTIIVNWIQTTFFFLSFRIMNPTGDDQLK